MTNNKIPSPPNVCYSHLCFFCVINHGLIIFHKGAIKLNSYVLIFAWGEIMERRGSSKED